MPEDATDAVNRVPIVAVAFGCDDLSNVEVFEGRGWWSCTKDVVVVD
jgi:hypothetical protein